MYLILNYLATPGHNSGWAETPRTDRGGVDLIQDTPTPSASKRRSRWDETPSQMTPSATPSGSLTPGGATPKVGSTPSSASMTPTPGGMTPGATPMTPMAPRTPILSNSAATPVGHTAMGMATPTPGKNTSFIICGTVLKTHILNNFFRSFIVYDS